MSGEEDEQNEQGQGRHLALFPLPYQGHITPMLQLANLLHSRGFSITIIHLQLNAPDPSNHPNFRFEPISASFPANSDTVGFHSSLNTNCEGPLRDCLLRLQRESPQKPVSCLVTDSLLYITHSVAEELKLPRMMLRTSSPISLMNYALYPLLMQKGYLSIQDRQSELSVPELTPLRVKDLLKLPNSEIDAQCHMAEQIVNAARSATALILNSYYYLEQDILTELWRQFPIPIFLVGPLCKSSSEFSSSLLEQDQSCLDWLDKQAARSVLYVSFGSAVMMKETELVETAWGLANSEQPFLWVVRAGLVTGSEGTWPHLPEGFVEKTKGRGCIVKWAPQQKVLAHPAVGGFWTHSGWNSTLESICGGVPMICWAWFGDQPANARLVSWVWRVGLAMEDQVLRREEIERMVRRLMVEKEGEEMRERIRILKENAEICVKQGGSSYQSIDKLISLVLSLR